MLCSTTTGRYLMCWKSSAARDYNNDMLTDWVYDSYVQLNEINYFFAVGIMSLGDNKTPT